MRVSTLSGQEDQPSDCVFSAYSDCVCKVLRGIREESVGFSSSPHSLDV